MPPLIKSSAGRASLATLLSRVTGLLREQLIAYFFGATAATDAFNLAFRIPNLLRNLCAEGALSAALVPEISRLRAEFGDGEAVRLGQGMFLRTLRGVGIFSIAAVSLAPHFFKWCSPELSQPVRDLAVQMSQIMFPALVLVALAAVCMAILNSFGHFFLPVAASAIFNLVSVGAGFLIAWLILKRGGEPVVGLAIGVLLAAVAQVLIQWPALRAHGFRLVSQPNPSGRVSVFHALFPGAIGMGGLQLSFLLNTFMAVYVGAGGVSVVNYAFRLIQFPVGLFGSSIASALVPDLSCLEERSPQFSRKLGAALSRSVELTLVASVGLAFLSRPIVELIFRHGKFGDADAASTAAVVSAYCVGLCGYVAVKVLGAASFARGDRRTPVVLSLLSVGVGGALGLGLRPNWGVVGLAAATSVGALLNAIGLLISRRRDLKLKELGGRLLVSGSLALGIGGSSHYSWSFLARRGFSPIWVLAPVLQGIFLFLVIRTLERRKHLRYTDSQ